VVSNANIELKSKTLVHGARYGLLICFYRYIYIYILARPVVSETIKYKTLSREIQGQSMAYYISLSIEIVF